MPEEEGAAGGDGGDGGDGAPAVGGVALGVAAGGVHAAAAAGGAPFVEEAHPNDAGEWVIRSTLLVKVLGCCG